MTAAATGARSRSFLAGFFLFGMTGFATFVHIVGRLAKLMAGITFCFFTGNIRTLATVSIFGVMAGFARVISLMFVMREMNLFLATRSLNDKILRSTGCSNTNAGNGAGEGKGKSSCTDNHLFHLFPLTKYF